MGGMMTTVGTNLRTLRSRRFRRTCRPARDTSRERLTSISFKVEATALEQSAGSRGRTFLGLIIIVSLLFPGLSLAASRDATIDGAKKEAKLVVYTAMQPEDSTKLIELYRSRFPFVDASFFRAGSAPLLNRILTESRAGRFLFDVVSGKVSDLLLLQKKGLLGTMPSSELTAYPAKFRDNQNRWVDIYNNYYTIAYNRERVRPSEVPASWDDLLDLKCDGIRFESPYPDRQNSFRFDAFEDDDRCIGVRVHDQGPDFYFDQTVVVAHFLNKLPRTKSSLLFLEF